MLGKTEPRTAWFWGLLVCAALPYFVNLGAPALWDANEPLYTQPPAEVLTWDVGDFWAPTWNGRTYAAHPPLSTWVMVPSYLALGINEFAARLPLALAALAVFWGTYLLGRRLGGRRIGLLAVLVLAGTPRFWLFARQLAGDVLLVACLVPAFALGLPAVEGEKARGRQWAAHALVGLGFLAKGPVILALYLGGLGLAWLSGRPRGTWKELRPWRGILVMVLLGMPWFIYMSVRYDWFFSQHFGWYTFRRLEGSIGMRPPWWYLTILVGDAQPWLMLVPLAFLRWRRSEDRRPVAWLPWTAAGFCILLFSMSMGKRAVYMLPLYPMQALIVAPVLAAAWDGARSGLARLAGAGLGIASVVAAVFLWLMSVNAPGLRPEIFAPLAVLIAAALGLFVAAALRSGRAVTAIVLAATLALQAATALGFDAIDRFRPVPALAAEIAKRQSAEAPEPAIIYRAPIHSLNFYLGRRTEVARDAATFADHMGDAPRAFVLVLAHREQALREDNPTFTFDELARGPELRLHFRSAVLGQKSPTRDLLLLEARPRDGSKDAPGALEPGR